LLASRFNLKIGIWDLVNNSTLRTTLLETATVTEAPKDVSSIPRSAMSRAETIAKSKEDSRRTEEEALASLLGRAKVLADTGWRRWRPGFNWMEYPLTEPLTRWPEREGLPEQQPFPLVSISLRVNKRSVVAALSSTICDPPDIQAYVNRCKDRLAVIPKTGKVQLDGALWPVLWEAKGGWADPVDWETRFNELAGYAKEWKVVLGDLAMEALRVRVKRFEPQRATTWHTS
jgi:hypothetical protein